MEVPAEQVIQRLVNRIAELEYQLAVAQAGLAQYEGQVDVNSVSTD